MKGIGDFNLLKRVYKKCKKGSIGSCFVVQALAITEDKVSKERGYTKTMWLGKVHHLALEERFRVKRNGFETKMAAENPLTGEWKFRINCKI